MSAISKSSLKFTALSVSVVALFKLAGCAVETTADPGEVGGSAGLVGGAGGSGSGMGGATMTGGATSTGGAGGATGGSAGGTSTGGSGGVTAGAGGSVAGAGAAGGVGGSAAGGAGSGGATTGGAGSGGATTGGAGAGGSDAGGAGAGAGAGAGGGAGGTGPTSCPALPTFPNASALTNLGMKIPDPFKFYDGTPVTTKAQWECRRKEILAMAAKYLYGPVPGDCDEVSGTVSGATVSITCKVGNNSANFSASISGSGKSINFNLGSGILPSGGKTLSLGSGNEAKIKTLYGISELNPNIANGWMINRVMDVLEKNPGTHDPKTIAVSGCSGCGKGAFLAGVFSRAPIVVIVESGGGGGSSWRMNEWFSHGEGKSIWDCSDRPQGIDVLEETGICGPWVTSAAASFRAAPATVNNMPFDQHLLLATIAPRYLVHFTNNNGAGSWCWLGGTAEAMASWAAHSVYKALGVEKNHSMEVYNGGHCGVGDTGIAAAMFKRALDGDMAADTGKVNIQDSRVQVPVSEWKGLFVDWNMDTVLQ